MMTTYAKGSEYEAFEYFYDNDYIFGRNEKQDEELKKGNYYNLTIARNYYEEALKTSRNKEDKAMATLMLHCCNKNLFYLNPGYGDEEKIYKPTRFLFDFYEEYKNTNVFRMYNCPGMDYYVYAKK
jgi:hypothetical protein